MNLQDGESWYILANGYLSNFFVNYKNISELQSALKCYGKAVSKEYFNNL